MVREVAGTIKSDLGPVPLHSKGHTLRCNVWVGAAFGIVKASKLAIETLDVFRCGCSLIFRSREVLAEPTTGDVAVAAIERCHFGCEVHRPTNRGNVRAGSWESGKEFRSVLAIV